MRISGITFVPRKTNHSKSILMIILVLIILLILLVFAVSAKIGWGLTHPAREVIPAFSANIVPDFKPADFMDSEGKVRLKGWYFECRGSDRTVIVSHGYGRSRLQFHEKTFNLVKSFLSRQYNVLLYDFRNSGESGGNLTSVGFYEKYDLLGAVAYVKKTGAKHIILLGYSMGAATSIIAAAEPQGSDVDAIISDSAFADLDEYLKANLSVWSGLPAFPFNQTVLMTMKLMTGIDTRKMSPKKVIVQLAPKPILFIHSKDDQSIPAKNSAELFRIYSEVAGDNAVYWETSGAPHPESYDKYPDEYTAKIYQFLDDNVFSK